MAIWKITPKYKKSVIERGLWITEGKTIVNEIGWRRGEFIVETEGDEVPEIDMNTNLFFADNFEVIDWSTEDGCWEDNEFIGFTEEEQEEMEEFLSENSLFDLEEDGWTCDETEVYITCEVDIEKEPD
jgi:hypothetical protein